MKKSKLNLYLSLAARKSRRFVFSQTKGLIITGLFVTIPIFVTLWVALFVYNMLTTWALAISERFGMFQGEIDSFWFQQGIRLFSLILIVILLIVVGQLARMTLGNRLITIAQKLLLRLPIINFIYSTCKQIGDALWSSSGSMFSQVVMFEYPCQGSYAIGFMTNENKEDFEVTEKLGKPVVSIFMPTTPNPTSGFLLLIPKERCIFLDMSVSDAMRLIVSAGAILPGQHHEAQQLMEKTKRKR